MKCKLHLYKSYCYLKEEGITEKEVKKLNKIVLGIIVFLCVLLVIYLGMTVYFVNHFYFGTEINSINVSGKSVEKVKKQMRSELQTYTLNLKERGERNEQIKGDEIGLKYNPEDGFENLKDTQNPFAWLSAFFNVKDFKLTIGVLYDEKLLKEQLNKLACFDSSNIIEPKNPTFKYVDNAFVIVDEVNGNRVNKDILYEHVADAILNQATSVDLEAINCYVKPQYTSKSQKIIEVKDTLNRYVSSKITYTFGERKEILDGAIINNWLTVDENYEITFDEKKVKSYVEELATNYNSIGKIRNFVTSSGKIINLGGGDYGLSIDTDKESAFLSTAIKEGQTMTKEPAYIQTAFSQGNNDIGNTYVEIDILQQHLWFYKNGALIAEGDVVTGDVSSNHATPEGIYKLKYKEKNTVLRGADYTAPVDFWMPFNGGIGIHDASWRNEFGGNIYKTNGSHGCVNSPYYLAKAIYDNIDAGTPIICYY